ncbi:MAG TPA: ADOP family duplicated permease [Rhodanobacteraceae bacterium]|nr:ADOP family duplicated permease [Rhodanobacteraceae bacterium]
MSAVFHEIRNAARGIAARPAFPALIVGVLGAGLACVLFTLVFLNGLVWKPLPFAQPQQLLHLGLGEIERPDQLGDIAERDVFALRQRLAGIADVAGYIGGTINLSDGDKPERYDGTLVSTNLMRVLGVAPELGRGFQDADGRKGAAPTVVLSDALWRSRYNADPAIIGRQVRVNAHAATVVGVMPPDFSFPARQVIWIPANLDADATRDDGNDLAVIARRHADTTMAAVRTALAAWQADTAREAPNYFHDRKIGAEPMTYLIVDRKTRGVLDVMLLAVILVLLVACANAANLLLTRTLARRQELAVRAALGASRGRLIVHLLSQSMLLACAACAIALPVGWLGAQWIDRVFRASDEGPPHWMHFGLDGRMIAFAVIAALLTGLITGLLPALRAGSGVNDALRDDSRAVAGGAFARVSRVLVIGEIALSCVLLVSAGVMVRGIGHLQNEDFGIRQDGLLTARVGLSETQYTTGARRVDAFKRLGERLRAEPGVVDAAVGTTLPGLISDHRRVARDGAATDDIGTAIYTGAVDDHFAATYRLTLEHGRLFNDADRADTTPVAVVDDTFVEHFGDGKPVLGRRFRLDPSDPEGTTVTVVGVIKRIQLDDLDDPAWPALLVPLAQNPARFASLAIRTRGAPAAFAPRLAAIVKQVDPDAPAYWVRTYEQVIVQATFAERVLAQLFMLFGLIALFLAAAGLYGVIAFGVRQRTREIGVRRALGAPAGRVLRNLLGRGAWQVALGLAIGLALAWPFAGLLVRPMNGFDPADPDVYVAVFGTLALVALIAILVPARRALAIDPVIALRHE